MTQKSRWMAAFSVAAVLFSAHAGGGFATGNQANTYFVGLGWSGLIGAVVAMGLLVLVMREAMVMYNARKLGSYKELFQVLYHPFDRLEILFEIFFNIMVLMAVAAAVSGAASALVEYFGWNYMACVIGVGCVVLTLTIFGSGVVIKASSIMSILILISAISIYLIGLVNGTNIFDVLQQSIADTSVENLGDAIVNGFTYAGFQCVTLPTMIVCGSVLKSREDCSKSMSISFVMNTIALILSILMLLSWQSVYTSIDQGTTIPTLTICKSMGMAWLEICYGVCLLMCLISTGVTTTFGFVSRFERISILKSIKSDIKRRMIVSCFIIVLSMTISMVGLSNIIKYGYGYCGYFAILIVVIPFLTVGVYKNRVYKGKQKEGVKEYAYD